MTELEKLVEQLLYEEEGPSLDFKREQYPFAGESAEAKSELLKDILAFANSWRRTDAYILIGVSEVQGGRSEVVGVTHHLEDADLQQFVNSKTQQPVTFSYRAARCDSKEIGVLHIAYQKRPIFLRKDYGNLLKNVVYVRRGSSTAQALPDEIAKMGREQLATASLAPDLTLAIASSQYELREGSHARFRVRWLNTPEPQGLPDYEKAVHPFADFERVNYEYYRDLARYITVVERTKGFHIIVENIGRTVANDVRVGCEADLRTGILLSDSSVFPRYPRTGYSMLPDLPRGVADASRDVWVQRRKDRALADGMLGKIQAGSEAWTSNRLFVGSRITGQYTVTARIFCDELPEPIEQELVFDIEVSEEDADIGRLEELADERARSSDEAREYLASLEEES